MALNLKKGTSSANSVCDNVAVESFDSTTVNAAKEVAELRIALTRAKRNVRKLERALRVAERELKAAQEKERANKIKALLEANKGKRVIVEWSIFDDEADKVSSALAEEIEITLSCNNNLAISCPKEHWGGLLEIVTRIYVEAEI